MDLFFKLYSEYLPACSTNTRLFKKISKKMRAKNVPVTSEKLLKKWKKLLKGRATVNTEAIEEILQLHAEVDAIRRDVDSSDSETEADNIKAKFARWTPHTTELFFTFFSRYLLYSKTEMELFEKIAEKFQNLGKRVSVEQIKNKWTSEVDGSDAISKVHELQRRWYDHYVKITSKGVDSWPQEKSESFVNSYIDEPARENFRLVSCEMRKSGYEVTVAELEAYWEYLMCHQETWDGFMMEYLTDYLDDGSSGNDMRLDEPLSDDSSSECSIEDLDQIAKNILCGPEKKKDSAESEKMQVDEETVKPSSSNKETQADITKAAASSHNKETQADVEIVKNLPISVHKEIQVNVTVEKTVASQENQLIDEGVLQFLRLKEENTQKRFKEEMDVKQRKTQLLEELFQKTDE